jgi:integrase
VRSRRLTRDGRVFQIRVPKALDPALILSPIRVTLGNVPNLQARRIADVLSGLAHIEFARVRSAPMNDLSPADARRHVENRLTAVLPTLLGLGVLAQSRLPAEIAEPAIDGTFDLLAHIGMSRARGGGPAGRLRPEVPIAAALTDENLARGLIGLPQVSRDAEPDPIMAKLIALEAKIDAKHRPHGPMFSEAAETFIAGRVQTYGNPEHSEIGYLRHRAAVFLAIVGDKPVDAYDRADLQHFANELSWLPPNTSKQHGYDVGRVAEYIAANKVAEGPGLAEKSIEEGYVGRIKTMLRESCADAKVPSNFGGRIVIPKRAAPSIRRMAPDQDEFGKVVATGVGSGILSDALLPPLGQLTGRRLGLLVFMRRENILRYNGVWVYRPQSHEMRNGRWEPIPFKTTESLSIFVLHQLFATCGFIEWAVREPGPIFPMLMRAKDPADAAQKRMKRLYEASGADPQRSSTFHGLRTGKIRNDRDLELPARAVRLQVGHELTDVHDRYDGQMTDGELRAFATAPLPPGVDWSLLGTIDFEAFAARKPTGGRPPKDRAVVPARATDKPEADELLVGAEGAEHQFSDGPDPVRSPSSTACEPATSPSSSESE